jgi:hypothetical protein
VAKYAISAIGIPAPPEDNTLRGIVTDRDLALQALEPYDVQQMPANT